jgi:hypothetical protein
MAHPRIGRLPVALALAAPGLLLAMAAKPMVLGDGVLFFGLLAAFGLPLLWLKVKSS